MATGLTSALIIGGGAFSATSQVMAGNAQAKAIQQQAEYNAKIYDQQAEMIKEKKKIADTQFLRQSAQARGAMIASTAGKGFTMSGSPLAILIDSESQMQFDKAIQDYNLSIEQNYALSGATNTRQTGEAQSRLAKYTGYTGAFSSMLNTGATIGILNMKYNSPTNAGKL